MTKVIIIGGGMAGLSAGIHLQMNGYQTEIFEMGQRAGGLCTAWKRKDYLIDGCIHWMVGINQESITYKIWDRLLDMKSLKINLYEEFYSVEHEGKILHFYSDADKLNKHLKEISPQDSMEIDNFTNAIKRFSKSELGMTEKAPETMGFIEKTVSALRMIPMFFFMRPYTMPLGSYIERFKSPLIRNFLLTAFFPDMPVMILLMNAASFNEKNTGYPIGGSQNLVDNIVKRYESLGGKMHYGSKVEQILVEEGAARGIEVDGKKFKSDIVISAADGRATVMGMLEGKYLDPSIRRLYLSGKYEPNMATIYVSLGVKRKFDDAYKTYGFFDLKKPLVVDGKEVKSIGVTIHNFDPKSAPQGKTVMTMMIPSIDPKYWINLREKDPKGYARQKNAIALKVVDELEAHFSNIKDNMEVLDVTTPATYFRYTGNWNGAAMGWTDMSLFVNKPKKQIEGLKDFYMCGQWVGDAGLPGAIMSGRDVTQIICKRDGKDFRG